MTNSAWANTQNVLCIRLDNMGDVLMTTPAMRALKRHNPQRKLTLLTSLSGAPLGPHLPDIDELICFEAPWHRYESASLASDIELLELLRRRQFDGAIVFTFNRQNPLPAALMAYWAGIPLRAAYCRENPYKLLTDWLRETEPQEQVRHEVRRQLDLLETLGIPAEDEPLFFRVKTDDREGLGEKAARLGIDDQSPWIVIHPGSTSPARRYPPEHYAVAADLLLQRLHCRVIFTGKEDEFELIERIRGEMKLPSYSLAGQLTLGELGAAISQARVFICNNTGPAHIAAAIGTPLVVLYALTNPQHTPWMVEHRALSHDVPCKYCYQNICPMRHHDCLQQVKPEEVVAAACELWERRESGAAMMAVESSIAKGTVLTHEPKVLGSCRR